MAQAQKGLGRGLEALLGGYKGEETGGETQTLSLDAIRANPQQPRREFAPEALEELAQSIREQGLLQPVLVRPVHGAGKVSHEIIAGERRWRAARLAGLTEIAVLVREVDDEQGFALALVENLQREDLNPMEEAAGYQLLIERFGLSQDSLAKKVGKSRPAVANALRLLQLPEAMRADLAAGTLTAGHARALLSLTDTALREALWERVRESGLSVRQAEEAAGYAKDNGTLPPQADAARPARTRGEKSRSVKDRQLEELEGPLTQSAGVMAKAAGTPDHGKITFHFSSRRELEGLLDHFGLAGLIAAGAANE
ncbi:ParB/RepB/Spo0J family partition protein [Solidesulfovibrio sp.]|uniref:ParB/RepB/Spo0J family partition protein n=1 Tax=Solidesulfovibrio sp. TaxID=2910990 RepID=UPI00262FCEEA|nr:ParB/RepB/Spo0J family partition protein [Solidesulfovibrio sp.]